MGDETTVEKSVTRRLILDQFLGVFVITMIERSAGLEGVTFGHLECLELAGFALDSHGDVAQMYRLAGLHGQDQMQILVGAFDFAVDLRLVIAQRLRGLLRLFDGTHAEALKSLFIALAEAAHIPFNIGFELGVGRLDPHIQLRIGKRCAAGEHQEKTTCISTGKLHRRGC